MNPILTKNFTAEGAIAKRRFVKMGSDAGLVVQAAGVTAAIIGALDPAGDVASGARADVILAGIADVEAGGAIAANAPVTSDADGKAVAAAPAQGVNNYIGGVALSDAASGDIIPVLLAPSVMQGA